MASISQISQVKCWFAQFTVSVAKEKLFQSNFSLQLDFIASKNTGFIATQIRDNCHLEPDHVQGGKGDLIWQLSCIYETITTKIKKKI